MKRNLFNICLFVVLGGCAGFQRGCNSWGARNFGADWLIAQYNYSGDQIHCWTLINRSVANEEHSDGIYWTSGDGHLVHIGGWYTRVQVKDGGFESAARENNIDLGKCHAEADR